MDPIMLPPREPVTRTRTCLRVSPAAMSHASQTDEERAAPWIGRVVGRRHRIIRHIATGGMGHVFLAQHITLGGFVAVKVLLAGSDSIATRYFCHEARLLSRLSHPNIVSAVDCGVLHEGGCYFVMEWIPGADLGHTIATHGPLDPKRALWVLTQVASAIDYLHSVGLVHRDIKADNVICHPGAYDAVKLFDFGIAVAFRSPPDFERNKLIGTPQYMAPEQAAGGPPTPAIDHYALGALALELMTGHAPYARSSAGEILTSVLTKPPSMPSDHGLRIEALDSVIAKALSRNPQDRFQSGLELVLALRMVIRADRATATLTATPSPPPMRSSMRPTIVRPKLRSPRLRAPSLPVPRWPAVSGFAALAVCAGSVSAALVI